MKKNKTLFRCREKLTSKHKKNLHRLALVSQQGTVQIINRKLKQTQVTLAVSHGHAKHQPGRGFTSVTSTPGERRSFNGYYSPQSPCQPTCTRPSWTAWRARRSAQRDDREKHDTVRQRRRWREERCRLGSQRGDSVRPRPDPTAGLVGIFFFFFLYSHNSKFPFFFSFFLFCPTGAL